MSSGERVHDNRDQDAKAYRPGPVEPGRESRGWELAAWGAVLAGLAIRCLPWPFVFRQGGVFFPGVDPYYHVYRAWRLAETFPHWSLWDKFLRHPLGAPSPYLVGFDGLLALPGLLGLGREAVEAWAALLPVLLGALAVYLVYRLGRLCVDAPTGVLAAYLYAMLIGPVNYTVVGRADHHAVVAPVVLGGLVLLLVALRRRQRATVPALAGGLLAGWSVALWPVTPPLYYLPALLLLLVLALLGRFRDIRRVALCFSLGAASAATLAVLVAGDLARWPHELTLPSSVSLLCFWAAAAWLATACWRPRGSFLLVAAGMVLFGLVLRSSPRLAEPWNRLLQIATRQAPFLLDIKESESLLRVDGVLTHRRLIAFYSNLAFFVPFSWLALVALVRREGRRVAAGKLLLLVYGLLGSLLTLFQQRLGEFGAAAIVLLLAWSLVSGFRAAAGYLRRTPSRGRASILAGLLLLAVGSALVPPVVRGAIRLAGTDTVARNRELVKFGRDLARQLDRRPGERTTGILAGEKDSVVMLYALGLPIVVSSFAGTAAIERHNARAFAVLLSDDEAAALGELEALRVRYLVVSSILDRVEAMAAMSGIREPLVERYRSLRDGDLAYTLVPRPRFTAALHTRLLVLDGSAGSMFGRRFPALGHFRLLRESAARPWNLYPPDGYFKAFEVVRGARISGAAPPGERVELRLSLRTNSGRVLTYQAATRADAEGRFSIVVPYSTDPDPARAVRVLSPYRIKIGAKVHHLLVSEQAVQQGLEVGLPP